MSECIAAVLTLTSVKIEHERDLPVLDVTHTLVLPLSKQRSSRREVHPPPISPCYPGVCLWYPSIAMLFHGNVYHCVKNNG